ncbi:MAG: hypothetical protein RBU29_00655, partial [bacterium]|nr:hypothetical protein [bacterium]
MSNSTNHSMKNKGPWLHRASILFFSILFGLLLFWLMGFIDRDIKYSGRPNYVDMERAQIPAELLERQDQRKAELNNVERKIAALKTDQQNLRDRTESQQKSLNQLVAIKRMKIEKNLVIEEQEQTALAELETQFLQDQKAYDALNQDLVALTETQHGLQDQIYQIETQLEAIRKTVREEYDKAVKAHEFQAAIVRLVVLVPVFALAIGFFVRERNGKYATMAYAFAIAVFVKVLSALHDYFPELYFKYI